MAALRDDQIKQGLIFSAFHHAADWTDNSKTPITGTEYKTKTMMTTGPWVFTKLRKFIIAERFKTGYIAIPLYTYDGNGLAKRTDGEEHIGVKDQDERTPAEVICPHQFIIARRIPAHASAKPGDFYYMHPKAYAHFTKPVAFDIVAEVEIQGHIIDRVVDKPASQRSAKANLTLNG